MKTTLLVFSLVASSALNAQKICDVIYLDNGSILRGNIVERNDSVVKIATCCESIFAVPAGEVLNIAQEKASRMAVVPRNGYLNQTSMGILIGSGEDKNPAPFSALMEHLYRFNKTIALGGFFGLEQLHENTMPLGALIKLFIPAGRTDLYWSMSGGYSISLEKPKDEGIIKATGGVLAGTELGVIIPVSQGAAITFAMGYRYSELNYNLTDWWRGDYERMATYRRFMVRFGIAIF